MQYFPSKSDTSLFIKMLESEVNEKTEDRFHYSILYDLFLHGLNVVVEYQENQSEFLPNLRDGKDKIKISQYGMQLIPITIHFCKM